MHIGICRGNQWKGPESIRCPAFSTGLFLGAQGQGRASAGKGGAPGSATGWLQPGSNPRPLELPSAEGLPGRA